MWYNPNQNTIVIRVSHEWKEIKGWELCKLLKQTHVYNYRKQIFVQVCAGNKSRRFECVLEGSNFVKMRSFVPIKDALMYSHQKNKSDSAVADD